MDGWKVMHQTVRVAAPRDPLVQHICLHICLVENCLIIALNSYCSKSGSLHWSAALNRQKTFCVLFADILYVTEGRSFWFGDICSHEGKEPRLLRLAPLQTCLCRLQVTRREKVFPSGGNKEDSNSGLAEPPLNIPTVNVTFNCDVLDGTDSHSYLCIHAHIYLIYIYVCTHMYVQYVY